MSTTNPRDRLRELLELAEADWGTHEDFRFIAAAANLAEPLARFALRVMEGDRCCVHVTGPGNGEHSPSCPLAALEKELSK